jgi:hypothetical protein
MKNLNVKTILLLAIIAFGSASVKAQVTIGSADISPIKGALLELKTKDAPINISGVTYPNNSTVDKNGGGLGLPRVLLVSRKTLEPFIPDNSDWTANTDKVKERNAGLMVYNLTEEPSENLRQGIYVWNGSEWSMMGGKRFFYLPSFNIEIDQEAINPHQYDLYEEYKKQFNKNTVGSQFVSSNPALTEISSLENGDLYERDELDYVVTYFDDTVMTVISVTGGIMLYNLDSFNFSEKTFVNVVLVVK